MLVPIFMDSGPSIFLTFTRDQFKKSESGNHVHLIIRFPMKCIAFLDPPNVHSNFTDDHKVLDTVLLSSLFDLVSGINDILLVIQLDPIPFNDSVRTLRRGPGERG